MKKLILILFILTMLSSTGYSQGDRIFQRDSLKSGRTSTSFLIATKHNYNTIMIKGLTTGDSITVFNINEAGDTMAVALRNLNNYSDLASNMITNYSGNYEFLILHPNIYRLLIKCTTTDVSSKTLYIRRRGNNLK